MSVMTVMMSTFVWIGLGNYELAHFILYAMNGESAYNSEAQFTIIIIGTCSHLLTAVSALRNIFGYLTVKLHTLVAFQK